MPRRPASITQADVARAIRAAKQAGAREVEVRVQDKAVIVIRIGESTDPLEREAEVVLRWRRCPAPARPTSTGRRPVMDGRSGMSGWIEGRVSESGPTTARRNSRLSIRRR